MTDDSYDGFLLGSYGPDGNRESLALEDDEASVTVLPSESDSRLDQVASPRGGGRRVSRSLAPVGWADVDTLEQLRQVEPTLAEALLGKSKDFFIPESVGAHWEVERKPYQPEALLLRPNKPVSRAWDFVFRVVLSRLAPLGLGPPPYLLSSQAEPPTVGPQRPDIELPDHDRAESKQAVKAINLATSVANAVARDAALRCEREHEELARDLGLDRPRPGFR